MQHRRLPRSLSWVVAVVALGAVCGLGCRGSGERSAADMAAVATTNVPGSPTPPPPTPTPTRPPPDPTRAEQLRAEGEYKDAAAVYGSIVATASGAAQQDARVAQAQLLVRAGEPAAARVVLEAHELIAGMAGGGGTAQYMLASTLDDLGDSAGALALYERYIAANSVLSDFARIERAKLLARLGRAVEATQAGDEVLNASRTTPWLAAIIGSFPFSMGRAFEAVHDDVNALAWYERAKADDFASAVAREGPIKRRLGDTSWASDYVLALARDPSAGAAPDLLDELDAAAMPIGDYVRGVVDYRAGRNDAARAALARAAAAGDHAPESTYYLGALAERADDKEAAIADYGRAYDLDPAGDLAASALWWRGRLLEDAGRFADAGQAYALLALAHPASEFAGDAEFRRGLVAYRAKDFNTAADLWGAETSTEHDDRLRARFWRARALTEAKDPRGKQSLQELAADPDAAGDFYALRAEVLLGKNERKDKNVDLKASDPDWKAVAAYVRQATGIDPEAASILVAADPRWTIGAELEKVGLRSQSDAVFRSMLRDGGGDVPALFAIAQRFQREGRTSLAARAATLLAARLTRPGVPPPPDDLLRAAYPPAYGEIATEAAKHEKVSPLLLLALVRQESFYDPDAGSTAGALGLTQVVPSTGEGIAERLGISGFKAADLYRPKTSLQFGASYLASQLKSFDNNIYHTLAAYNGGPGAASHAIAAGKEDDLFVEELEFAETRLYVRLVAENYAWYRQLYGGLDRPSLPG